VDEYDFGFEREADPAQQEVEDLLRDLFSEEPQAVFYGRQIVVRFERQYFHWITNRALRNLAQEGEILVETKELWPGVPVKFYFSLKCRYWRRQSDARIKLIQGYSNESFGRALGHQGETMFDAALGGKGFRVLGKNVSEFGGRKWEATGENLDRVYERDGLLYGSEIKNSLDYIPHEELNSKLEACKVLGLTPLFIVRMAPKTYMNDIIEAGGYGLLFGQQLYPFGQDAFAAEVRAALDLPVGCPAAIPDGLVQRFETWHERRGAA